MTIQQLIGLGINGSMFLIVFALGLSARLEDALYVLRRPSLLLRSLFAMHVVMLVAAIVIALLFNPATPVKIALFALALSPVPPILPGKELKAGGTRGYTLGLLMAAAAAAIVVVPLGMWITDAMFGLELRAPVDKIVSIAVSSVILPLLLGILARSLWPALAERAAKPVTLVAWLVLIIAVLPVLFIAWGSIVALVGNGLLLGLVAFALIGLCAGHWLGGPYEDDRTVLALVTSTRHPGVAIAIAGLNFPDEKAALVVVIVHLLVGIVAAAPYVRWRTKLHAAAYHKEAT